jgi:hypothetical protein
MDDNVEKLAPPLRWHISIDSFTEPQVKLFFRFKKDNLKRLFLLLEFPLWPEFRANRMRMSGEEVFLRGLYELCSGENKQHICENVMGREFSAQSRAFTFFVEFMFDKFHHLVHDSLPWWFNNGIVQRSAEAIQEKMFEQGLSREADICYLPALFIDCNCLQGDVVGGGPAEAGINAARWDERIQRSFYNGWKSVHGLKHQTVDCAYGLTIDIYGPTSLRRNDLTLLRNSNINDRIAALQVDSPNQLIIFGDSAYKRQSHITSYFGAGAGIELRR